MAKFILSGDTHGELDLLKVADFFRPENLTGEYTKEDYLVLLGDAGILWDDGGQDKFVQHFFDDLPVTVLWIDGNHENFDLLEEYPEEIWKGGKVQRITNNILRLKRGQVFEVDGVCFFTFGGGNSIDKAYRREGISWWVQEMPTQEEYEEGIQNLEKVDWKVDYIFTHTCPMSIAGELVSHIYPGEEELQRYFEHIATDASFEGWYFGHWHVDEEIDQFHCLYNDMIVLG